jgi:hypothetical protein
VRAAQNAVRERTERYHRVMTTRIETILYDADGNRTDDDAAAVRAETVELDADGNVVNTHAHDSLAWKVDPISLEGDAGESATRPKHD